MPPRSKARRGASQASRKIYQQRAALKKSGLLSKRVDLRKKPTKHQVGLIKKLAGVLTGKRAAVPVSKEQAKKFKAIGHDVINNTVIVDRNKGEKFSVSKSGNIVARGKVGKRRTRRIIAAEPGGVKKPRKGKRRFYRITFAHGGSFTTDDFAELKAFMEPYQDGSQHFVKGRGPFARKGWKDWRKHVEIIDVDESEAESGGELEE